MSRRDQVCRFCVGESGGVRSAVYRVWAQQAARGKCDVFIGPSEMAGSLHVSLHPERGHLGVDRKIAANAQLDSRFLSQWVRDPSKIEQGELAFELVIPTSELQAAALGSEEWADQRIHWIPAAPAGCAQEIGVILAAAARAEAIVARLPGGLTMFGGFELGTGDRCLLMHGTKVLTEEWIAEVEAQKDRARTRKPDVVVGDVAPYRDGDRNMVGYRRGDHGAGWIETNLLFDSRRVAS